MLEYIEKESTCKVLAQDYAYAAADIVRNIPAADVAPVVHARWVVKRTGYAKTVAFCSACGEQSEANVRTVHEHGADITEYIPILTNYCPNCGAKCDLEG